MSAERIARIEEAEALHFVGENIGAAMDAFAAACRAAGIFRGEDYWAGRAAGVRFATARVLRSCRHGETPACIMLQLASLAGRVSSRSRTEYARGWLRGVEEICRVVFQTGLDPDDPSDSGRDAPGRR